MADRYQGDPKMILTEDGSNFVFPGDGGQPLMDAGLENAALISLFTEPGWAGNVLFQDPDEQIGSGYEAAGRATITLSNLNDLENEAELALKWMIRKKIASRIKASSGNPNGNVRITEIVIEPPGKDAETILLTKYGENWINQTLDPAYKKV